MDQLSWEVKYHVQKAKVPLLMTMSYMVACWWAPSCAANVTHWAVCPPHWGGSKQQLRGPPWGLCASSVAQQCSLWYPTHQVTTGNKSQVLLQGIRGLALSSDAGFFLWICDFSLEMWFLIGKILVFFALMPASHLDTHCHLKLTSIPPGQKQNAIKNFYSQ